MSAPFALALVAATQALPAAPAGMPVASGGDAAPARPGTPAPAAIPAPAHIRAHRPPTPGDPLEGFNRAMFGLFRTLDRAIIRPAAMGYKAIVPRVVRSGIRNVIRNLGEPVVFINDMLQLRPKRAARTLARFAMNSTLGVGGLIDVGTHEKFPHRTNGFGGTLAYYGVGGGPYLFLPVLGPGGLRDTAGGIADGLVLPTIAGFPFDRRVYVIPRTIVGGLDQRVEADAELNALYAGALDPYATLRSSYLQNRAAQIRALKAPGRDEGDAAPGPDDFPADPAVDPAASPPAGPAAAPAATPLLDDPMTDPAATAPVATPGG